MKVYIYNENCVRAGQECININSIADGDVTEYMGTRKMLLAEAGRIRRQARKNGGYASQSFNRKVARSLVETVR